MARFTVKRLSSGYEVRLRPVPPLAQSEVLDMSRYVHPPVPMQEVRTGKDKANVEYVAYGANHPEMIAWRRECEQLEERQRDDGAAFSYSFGVHSWRLEGEWLTGPPKDWQIDPAFVKLLGNGSDFQCRLAFIKTELILSTQDLREVNEVIYSVRAVGEADMDAIEQLFRNPIQVRALIQLLQGQLTDDGELPVP